MSRRTVAASQGCVSSVTLSHMHTIRCAERPTETGAGYFRLEMSGRLIPKTSGPRAFAKSREQLISVAERRCVKVARTG